MGISVSPSSLHKKKMELIKQQEKGIKSMVTAYVENCSKNYASGTENIEENTEATDDCISPLIEGESITEIKEVQLCTPLTPIEILGDIKQQKLLENPQKFKNKIRFRYGIFR